MWQAILSFLKNLFKTVPPVVMPVPVKTPPAQNSPDTPARKNPLAPVEPSPFSPLSRGQTGADVMQLQKQLVQLGFDLGAVDGVFGSQTENAVKAFQTSMQLPVTGVVDQTTDRDLLIECSKIATKPITVPVGIIPSYSVKSPRALDKELEKLIDLKLQEIEPEAFLKAREGVNANMICCLAGKALTAMRVREATGKNDGVLVEKIQKTCQGERGDAWCMDQQQTQVAYAERKTGIVSKLPMSAGCDIVRNKCPRELQINVRDSRPGDIWIWEHASGSGHTGNFQEWIEAGVSARLNEGNTTGGKIGDRIVREGGGSYLTERLVTGNGDMVLKMCCRPF